MAKKKPFAWMKQPSSSQPAASSASLPMTSQINSVSFLQHHPNHQIRNFHLNQSFSLNSPSYIYQTTEQCSQRGLPTLPCHMAESKTASMSQTAVTCPSDLFEHAQGDEDLPLLLPRQEPESESEDDETLQDLVAHRSSHLRTEKKKAPKKGPKKMRKRSKKKKRDP
jgi:hypothetical protein